MSDRFERPRTGRGVVTDDIVVADERKILSSASQEVHDARGDTVMIMDECAMPMVHWVEAFYFSTHKF